MKDKMHLLVDKLPAHIHDAGVQIAFVYVKSVLDGQRFIERIDGESTPLFGVVRCIMFP